jgi:hypothetical protein
MPLFEPLTPTIQEVVESIQTRVRGLPNFKRDFTWPPDMFLLILAGILGDRHFRLLSPTPGWCPLGRVHANPAASSPGPCCAPLFSPACFPWFADALVLWAHLQRHPPYAAVLPAARPGEPPVRSGASSAPITRLVRGQWGARNSRRTASGGPVGTSTRSHAHGTFANREPLALILFT